MARPKKNQFADAAPKGNPYSAVIQSAGDQPAPAAPSTPEAPAEQEFYRFSLKMPAKCKLYLQERVWRKSLEDHKATSITDYISALVLADMEKHPEVMEGLDELNK